jgi:hypothetical protein
MRFLIFLIALTFMLPTEAGAGKAVATAGAGKVVAKAPKSKSKVSRKIANKLPSRVLTFVCRPGEGEPESVIGLTHMSIGLRDTNAGAFSSSIYLRTEKGYLPKTITGTYTTVPGGYIFRTKWQGLLGEYTMIHVHPAERSALPGIADKQICEVSAQLESP